METLDIVIIGAGQAGLALSYYLQQAGISFKLFDRNDRIGDSWRKRYDSLTLFTPRAYSALPGLPVPGDPNGCPTKDEIGDYLETYAQHFQMPVITGTGIQKLERVAAGFHVVTDSGTELKYRAVVLANGAFQTPAVPLIAAGLSTDVQQFTSASYRNPQQIPYGRVLIAGDGATGRQIAVELAATHSVMLAAGRPRSVYPERILGRSVFWWMNKFGLLSASRETAVGRYMMKSDSFPGMHLAFGQLRQSGVVIKDRATEASGRQITFADGSVEDVDAVIWATGYHENTGWVNIPEAKDDAGNFIHRRGVTPVPGLYLIGRSWQWTRGSALLHGVGADAEYLAGYIKHHLHSVKAVSFPTFSELLEVAR